MCMIFIIIVSEMPVIFAEEPLFFYLVFGLLIVPVNEFITPIVFYAHLEAQADLKVVVS